MYHAWRSLTPAMIEDIQTESARWTGKRSMAAKRQNSPGTNLYPEQGIPPPAREDAYLSMSQRSRTKPLTPTGSSLAPFTAPKTALEETDYAMIAFDSEGNPYWHIGETRYLTSEEIEEIKARRAPRNMPEVSEPDVDAAPIPLPPPIPETVDPGYWTFDPIAQKQCFVRGGKIIQYAP